MSLEIKHLVPYLPYDLNLLVIRRTIGINTESSIEKWKLSDIYQPFNKRYKVKSSKPILRPLSDLTKEIEVNGGKFVPIEVIKKEFDTYYVSYNFDGNLLFKRKNEGYTWLGDMRLINEKLLQWHFDIHNLIPAGLAIDINTLNK